MLIHSITDTQIGFIGLGNVGSKLAGNLIKQGAHLTVMDLQPETAQPLLDQGARWGESPKQIAELSDVIITCLPNPTASAQVMESNDGVLKGLSKEKIWLEMSTTDFKEVNRLGDLVRATGAEAVDCPVSGGCHRAATGNISIFAGCPRPTFDRILPILKLLGRRILHVGDLGTASILKVATNYLATAHLAALCEAFTVMKVMGVDLSTTYEAIRISSGNSFVHETEGQVILNGSRDISFTMDLVNKDISLFQSLADQNRVPLEISPTLIQMFQDGEKKYGAREFSPNIIKRLEEPLAIKVLAKGFPAKIVDDEPEAEGYEVKPRTQ